MLEVQCRSAPAAVRSRSPRRPTQSCRTWCRGGLPRSNAVSIDKAGSGNLTNVGQDFQHAALVRARPAEVGRVAHVLTRALLHACTGRRYGEQRGKSNIRTHGRHRAWAAAARRRRLGRWGCRPARASKRRGPPRAAPCTCRSTCIEHTTVSRCCALTQPTHLRLIMSSATLTTMQPRTLPPTTRAISVWEQQTESSVTDTTARELSDRKAQWRHNQANPSTRHATCS